MLDLPRERLAYNKPVLRFTGVDYFGLITVRQSKRTKKNPRQSKWYGVVFTYLKARVLNLELAGDLALRRHITRQGHK